MRSIAVLAMTLALGAAFAGCVGGDDDTPTNDPDESLVKDGDEPTDNSTASETPADVNTPPTAELTADVDTGAAPLLVVFNITGEDADGDVLTWTLDADGDGEADASGDVAPGEYAHNFTAAGNYSALLNLTDGTDAVERMLNITVAEPGPPAVMPEVMVFEGTITVGVQHPSDSTYQGLGNPANRIYDFTENRSVVSKMTLALEVSAGGIMTDLALMAPDGTEVAVDANTITVEDAALLQQEGPWTAQVRVELGVRVEYTLTVTFE